MILEKGNMWDVFGKTDLFLITTNPIVRKDGAGVMGRGIAKEAKERFPRIPYDLGNQVLEYQKFFAGTEKEKLFPHYGVLGWYGNQPTRIGFFMVKDHWASLAQFDIIKRSADIVTKHCVGFERVDLNFPGIGNGKLKREDVLPLIEVLPDNVHVWEYGE